MQVKEIMTKNVESISADASLYEAANRMARLDIGFLPVVDRDIIGVVTDRDIVVRGIAEGMDPTTAKVSEVVTASAECVKGSESVEQAAKVMERHLIRRLIVTDDRGAYVGVVTLGDLAAAGHKSTLSGEALEKMCST